MDTDFLKQFNKAIQQFPIQKQKRVFAQMNHAIALGLRAVILNGLEMKDKELFENLIVKKDVSDDEIFEFGQNHITNFEQQFNQVISETIDALQKDMNLPTSNNI